MIKVTYVKRGGQTHAEIECRLVGVRGLGRRWGWAGRVEGAGGLGRAGGGDQGGADGVVTVFSVQLVIQRWDYTETH